MRRRPWALGLFLLSINLTVVKGQSLPVGNPILEDYYRRQQLLGNIDSTISFAIRPLSATALQRPNVFDPEGVLNDESYVYRMPDERGYIQLLPVGVDYNFNSAYPYGWNDGSLVQTRGGQVRVYGGVLAKYRFLTLQLRPEYVQASNKRYEGMAKMPGYGLEWYKTTGNVIDQPEYFGHTVYNKLWLGQSSLKATFGPVSFGFSSENLYWGPGMRNSLLLSNNAAGFPHFTVHTAKPVSTPIGSFEGQLVGGTLKASGFPPSITGESQHQEKYYIEKPDVNRYFSGFIASYQPKWVPGLSLGIIRSFVINKTDMKRSLRDYLPFSAPR